MGLCFSAVSHGTETPAAWAIIEKVLDYPKMLVMNEPLGTPGASSVDNPSYEGTRYCRLLNPKEGDESFLLMLQDFGLVEDIHED